MASTYELIVKAVDQTKSPLRNIEKGLGRLEKKADGVSNTLKTVGGALAAFVTGRTLQGIVGTTAKFEDLRDTLAAVTGSAEGGNKAFANINKFAAKTSFQVADLTQTYIKLAGAGIKPTEKLLTTFSDAASVTTDSVGTLTAMTDLFSRTVSGGLGLEDLERLQDRGLPVYKMLEEQLQITRNEVSEYGKSAEGAAKLTEALVKAIDERFGGATATKMDNLSTGMSNFQDAINRTADTIGNEFKKELVDALAVATEFLEANDEIARTLGVGLGEAIQATSEALQFLAQNFEAIRNAVVALVSLRIISFLGKLASKLTPAIVNANGLKGVMSGLGKVLATVVMSPVKALIGLLTRLGGLLGKGGIIGVGVFALSALFGSLSDRTVKLGNTTVTYGEIADGVFTKVKTLGVDAFTSLKKSISGALQTDLFKSFASAVSTAFTNGFAAVITVVQELVLGFQMIGGALLSLNDMVLGVFSDIGSFIAKSSGISLESVGGFVSQAGEKYRELRDSAIEKFKQLTGGYNLSLGGMIEATLGFADKVINTFQFAIESAGAIIMSLPNFFIAVFKGISGVLSNFADGFVQKFANIIDAVKLVGEFKFSEAFTLAGKDSGFSFADSFNKNFKNVNIQGLTDERVKEIFNQDRVSTLAKAFADIIANDLARISKNFKNNKDLINSTLEQIGDVDLTNLQALENRLLELVPEATKNEIEEIIKKLRLEAEAAEKAAEDTGKLGDAMNHLDEKGKKGKEAVDKIGLSMEELTKKINDAIALEDANQGLFESFEKTAPSARELAEAAKILGVEYKKFIGPLEQAVDKTNEMAKNYKTLITQFGDSAKGTRGFLILQEGLKQLADNGFEPAMEKVKEYERSLDGISEMINTRFKESMNTLADDLASSLAKGKVSLNDFKSFFANVLEDITQEIIRRRITQPLVDEIVGFVDGLGGIGGGKGGGFDIFGTIGSFISGGGFGGGSGGLFGGSIIPGFLANGGIARAGSPYLVGERGPELFVPNTTGQVRSNESMGSGGNTANVTFNINAFDTKDAVQTLVENRDTITAIVSDSFNKQGRRGIIS